MRDPHDEPGAALMAEARSLVADRRWRPAIRVLESARRLREDDLEVDELMIVAATNARNRREVKRSRARLEASSSASSWVALASGHLVSGHFQAADRAARRALEIEPENAAAWHTLAASYAGLGWFGDAESCTEQASEEALDFERWQLGRAVNRWAMTNSHSLSVVLVLVFVFGTSVAPLACALGLTLPFLLRDLRIRTLDAHFSDSADVAWRTEHRLRLVTGLAVLLCTSLWMISLAITGS